MTTIVAFHAHPDDEVLWTGGTLARAAADGHRVVVVVATDGVMAEHSPRRLDELRASAGALGVHRVVHLGYADSGHGPLLYDDPPDRVRFARAGTEEAAGRLAALLHEENASLLLSYDSRGIYGHRDHVKVHEVGQRAAELVGVRVLQATRPFGSPHSFNVRGFARQKQVALAAHCSQLHKGRMAKVMRVLTRVPVPLFGLLMGREWFIK